MPVYILEKYLLAVRSISLDLKRSQQPAVRRHFKKETTFTCTCMYFKITLTCSAQWAVSADKLMRFSLFFPESKFHANCPLRTKETVCLRCQILLSGKENVVC